MRRLVRPLLWAVEPTYTLTGVAELNDSFRGCSFRSKVKVVVLAGAQYSSATHQPIIRFKIMLPAVTFVGIVHIEPRPPGLTPGRYFVMRNNKISLATL